MFDPTAFDNMKVVVEGAVYDRDLIGDILVINRDDLINLATLSRQFTIEFVVKESYWPKKMSGGIHLSASLENLSAELLASPLHETENGLTVDIFMTYADQITDEQAEKVFSGLEEIWGKQRRIEWATTSTKTNMKQQTYISTFTIVFERLIKEDQLDDVVDMIDYLIQSLQVAETIVNQ